MNRLQSFLNLGIGTSANQIFQVPALEVDGALVPSGALMSAQAQHFAWDYASSACNFSTSSGATNTITALQNYTYRFTAGQAMTLTLDSAYNIVNTMPGAFLGQKFPLVLVTNAATTIATPTLSDTAVTLSGTTTVTAAGLRVIQGQITQLNSTTGMATTPGTTFTSLVQVGSTNNFTVALGTNALVPVVGQLVYLNVTAGTLPSGWYPINLVTSAVSFVIATPPGTVWTATAATVGTSTVAPATYSPLLTLTGMYGTVLNIMVV